MPRFSISLDGELDEWVEQESERRRRSKADVVRSCIKAVKDGEAERAHAGRAEITPAGTDVVNADEIDELQARVEELEQDVAQLKNGVVGPVEHDTGDISAGLPDPPARPGQTDTAKQAVVEWVRQHGPVSRADILDAFEGTIEEKQIKPKSFWSRHARPALNDSGAEFTRNVGWRFPDDPSTPEQ